MKNSMSREEKIVIVIGTLIFVSGCVGFWLLSNSSAGVMTMVAFMWFLMAQFEQYHGRIWKRMLNKSMDLNREALGMLREIENDLKKVNTSPIPDEKVPNQP